MNVDPLAALTAQLTRSPASLLISDGGDFASKLTLGQLIKGRQEPATAPWDVLLGLFGEVRTGADAVWSIGLGPPDGLDNLLTTGGEEHLIGILEG